MRIVFLTQYFFPGGTYFRWHNLAINLKKLGHEVEVFSCDTNHRSRNRIEFIDGVKYTIIHGSRFSGFFGNPSNNLFSAFRLLFVSLPKADIYHVFQPFAVMGLKWLFEKRRRKTGKFLYDWDDLWIGGIVTSKKKQNILDYWMVSFFENFLPRRAHGVTTCSLFLETKLRELGVAQVAVIHNGCDEPLEVDALAARRKLGLQEGAIYLGFMGRTLQEITWCLEVIENTKNVKVRLALCGMPFSVINKITSNKLVLSRIDCLGELSANDAASFAVAIDFGLLPLEDSDFNKSRFPIKFADYQRGGAKVFYSNVGELIYYTDKLIWNIAIEPGKENFIQGVSAYFEKEHPNTGIDFIKLLDLVHWQSKAKQVQLFYES